MAHVFQDKHGTQFVPFYLNRKYESAEEWAAYKFDGRKFDGANWSDGYPTILYRLKDRWVSPWEWR